MTTDSCWHVLLLAVVLGWLVWAWQQQLLASHHAAVTAQVQRLLKPRTPDDCPACRKQPLDQTATAPSLPPVTPWRERKSRRGAMGRIATQPFACPNRTCRYYRVTDAQVHALLGDGTHAKCERIQTLRCQACGTTFSTRRFSPLGDATLPSENRVPARWGSPDGTSRGAVGRGHGAGLRSPSRDDHHLGDASG